MSVFRTALADPIAAKISWAESCLRDHRERLTDDAEIGRLLERLRSAARKSRDEMRRVGLIDLCASCESEEGGSCCGVGLEDRYDGVTLLINLLFGIDLQRSRLDSQSCQFLGDNGCSLLARDVICVNYVCQKITERISAESLVPLRELEGVELETLMALHTRVATVLLDAEDG